MGVLGTGMSNKPRNANELSEGQLHYAERLCSEYQNKVVFARWVEMKKTAKITRRIVVVGSYMVFVIKQARNKNSVLPTKKKTRFPGSLRLKIKQKYHLLALRSISVFKNNKRQLELQFYQKSPLVLFTPLVAEFIRQIRTTIRLFTYGFPNDRLPGLFGVDEENLLPLEPCNPADFGPANGFLHTFGAFSSFYKQPISEEVMRYVTDLHEAGVVEFRFQDCPGIEPKGEFAFRVEPLAATLRYNTYFKAISAVQLQKKDILFSLCNILRYNSRITKMTLSQLPEGNITELGEALQYNRANALQMIDLSGTHLSKGVSTLAATLQEYPHSLKVLNLSDCGLDGKQLALIAESLSLNYGMSLTIEELDLSNNRFDDQATIALETWFSKAAEYSRLQILRLSNSNQSFGTIAAYFHFLSDLQLLDLSYSKLDQRAVQLLCSMLEKSNTLKQLLVSNCSLSNGYASAIVEAFLSNKRLHGTHLDLSNCDMNESDAESLARSLSLNTNCHTLNLSRNKFKERGLIGLLQSIVLSATQNLDTLILDNTYKNAYTGERVSSALMSVVNSLTSVKSISIAGGFATVAIPFLRYLRHTNDTLLELDISNNSMGDAAASAIADMLRYNRTLVRLRCDGNNISPSGWKMILASFMHNRTLVEMDFPWNDYARYSSLPKAKLEEFRAVLIDIQRALQTNHSDERMERLNPPPTRPLPTFVHPSANLPDRLTPSSGLSTLAASKINQTIQVPPETTVDELVSRTSQPSLFDQTYDHIPESSSEESQFEKDEITGEEEKGEEWYTDTESFSEEYDREFYDFEANIGRPPTKPGSPPPITLATLGVTVRNSFDTREPSEEISKASSSRPTSAEEDDEETMMSSDSEFDL